MRPCVLCMIVLAGLVVMGCWKRQPEAPVPPVEPPRPPRALSSAAPEWAPTLVPPGDAGKRPTNLGAVVSVSNLAGLSAAQTQKVSLLDITALQNPHPPLPPAEAARQLEVFERQYAGTRDMDQRLDLLDEIKKLAVPAVTPTLLNLFKLEPTEDLKLSILDAVSGTWGTFEDKLEVVKEGLAGTQTVAVRQAALDALIDLADPRTVAYVKALVDDPKPEVRDYAREVYQILTAPPK